MLKRVEFFLTLIALAALCGEGNEVSYKFQYYTDDDQVYVYTNSATASKKLNDHFDVSASMLVDAISAASRRDIRGLPPNVDGVTSATSTKNRAADSAVDAITSASVTDEKRYQPSATLTFTNDFIKMFSDDKTNDDPAAISITGIDSKENDYSSQTVSAALSQDLFQRNTTIGARFGKTFDQYFPAPRFIPPPTDVGWSYFGAGKRQTDNWSASFTQGLSMTTIMSVIAGYTYDRGYLSRPYNVYKINDLFRHELLPAEHRSMTLSGLVNQYIGVANGMSAHLEYRYYRDSWGQTSNTLGMELYSYLGEHIIVRPSLRIYSQSSAFFYKDYYSATDYYLTTDLKYRGGNTYTWGMKTSYELKDFVKPEGIGFFGLYPIGFDIEADYYTRESPTDPEVIYSHYGYFKPRVGFKALWIQSGLRFAY